MSRPQFSRRAARPIAVRRQRSVRLSELRARNPSWKTVATTRERRIHNNYMSMTESAGTALGRRPRFHACEQKGGLLRLFDSRQL